MTVSVVIPTLGGDCLGATLAALNRGTVVPSEIIVCVPPGVAVGVGDIPHPNVRVVVSRKRGQVSQRVAGFRAARREFVLQLDDDVCVDADCIEKLLAESSRLGARSAVSASITNIHTGESFYRVRDDASWLARRIHGKDARRPGAITRAGVNVGLDFSRAQEPSCEAEWLPGGCVLHRRENLVLDDYYPFSGKALGEDVLHSVLLRERGVSLFVVRDAVCATDPGGPLPRAIPGTLRQIRAEFRWRRRLVAQTSGSVVALVADIVHSYARRAFPALARRVRHGGLFVDQKPDAAPTLRTTVSLSTSASMPVRRKQSSA